MLPIDSNEYKKRFAGWLEFSYGSKDLTEIIVESMFQRPYRYWN